MLNGIKALAFDLDGTLYPDYRLNIRLIPFFLTGWRLLWAFGRARGILRAGGPEKDLPGQEKAPDGLSAPLRARVEKGDFYENQARLAAGALGGDPLVIGEKIERLIYRGWEPFFRKIRLFPQIRETLESLRAAGLKTGLLSDFPPETKLEYLGIADLWDAVLCSERVGALKPDPRPFGELAAALSLKPEQILYVGNSFRFDVAGAKGAGMKAAWLTGRARRNKTASAGIAAGAGGAVRADFSFFNYRQLLEYVLG
ncbi:MAG: HAD family hydrolase [Treponema sp.]|jgi:putative hydrolase of the HAD superfamily|nr:HAD family hydrolase [Treponema sp.]